MPVYGAEMPPAAMAASVYLDRTSAFAVLAYPAAVIATPRGNLLGNRWVIESHFAKTAGKAIDHYAASRESLHCRVPRNSCAMMGTSDRDRGRREQYGSLYDLHTICSKLHL